MASKKAIDLVKRFFKISELVSPEVLGDLGEVKAWGLFTSDSLMMLYLIRLNYGKPLIVNGRGYTQSGYRGLDCDIGAKYSAHRLGLAFDLKDARMALGYNWELYEFLEAGGENLGVRELEHSDFTLKGKNVGWIHCSVREHLDDGMRIITP